MEEGGGHAYYQRCPQFTLHAVATEHSQPRLQTGPQREAFCETHHVSMCIQITTTLQWLHNNNSHCPSSSKPHHSLSIKSYNTFAWFCGLLCNTEVYAGQVSPSNPAADVGRLQPHRHGYGRFVLSVWSQVIQWLVQTFDYELVGSLHRYKAAVHPAAVEGCTTKGCYTSNIVPMHTDKCVLSASCWWGLMFSFKKNHNIHLVFND